MKSFGDCSEEIYESLYQLDESPMPYLINDTLVPIRGELDDIAQSPINAEENVEDESIETWTPEQDSLLEDLVKKHNKKWKKVAQGFPGLRIRDLKNRWKAVQKRTRFTPEEDKVILDYYLEKGGNWKFLSRILDGRPSNVIKNRFYGTIKKKMSLEQKKFISRRFYWKTENEIEKIERLVESELEEEPVTLDTEAVSSLRVTPDSEAKLSDEEKRRKMQELYSKMAAIEAFMKKTQSCLLYTSDAADE